MQSASGMYSRSKTNKHSMYVSIHWIEKYMKVACSISVKMSSENAWVIDERQNAQTAANKDNGEHVRRLPNCRNMRSISGDTTWVEHDPFTLYAPHNTTPHFSAIHLRIIRNFEHISVVVSMGNVKFERIIFRNLSPVAKTSCEKKRTQPTQSLELGSRVSLSLSRHGGILLINLDKLTQENCALTTMMMMLLKVKTERALFQANWKSDFSIATIIAHICHQHRLINCVLCCMLGPMTHFLRVICIRCTLYAQ